MPRHVAVLLQVSVLLVTEVMVHCALSVLLVLPRVQATKLNALYVLVLMAIIKVIRLVADLQGVFLVIPMPRTALLSLQVLANLDTTPLDPALTLCVIHALQVLLKDQGMNLNVLTAQMVRTETIRGSLHASQLALGSAVFQQLVALYSWQRVHSAKVRVLVEHSMLMDRMIVQIYQVGIVVKMVLVIMSKLERPFLLAALVALIVQMVTMNARLRQQANTQRLRLEILSKVLL
jgi:hypothetical protein